MIEPVILRSLPHTGTLFVQSLLHRMIGLDKHLHVSVDFNGWRPLKSQKMVIPLRDPCLSYISHLNRENERPQLELHSRIAEYRDDPMVHFFPVDGPVGERQAELFELAAFVGAEPPETGWQPVNATPDHTGIKARYLAGDYADVQPVIDYVTSHPDVMDLYAMHGYELPWMQGVAA